MKVWGRQRGLTEMTVGDRNDLHFLSSKHCQTWTMELFWERSSQVLFPASRIISSHHLAPNNINFILLGSARISFINPKPWSSNCSTTLPIPQGKFPSCIWHETPRRWERSHVPLLLLCAQCGRQGWREVCSPPNGLMKRWCLTFHSSLSSWCYIPQPPLVHLQFHLHVLP